MEEYRGGGNTLCHCPPATRQVSEPCWGDLVPSWLDPVAAVQLALPRLLLSVLGCSLGAVVREQPVLQHGQRSIPLRGAFPTTSVKISLPEAVVSGDSAGPGSPLSILVGAGDLVCDRKFLGGRD